MKKLINILINIILISILIFSGYKIYTKLVEYKKADTIYNDIREKYQNSDKQNGDKTNKLSDINSDYRFWLKVDNTNINYPVVQSYDNDYYLTRDFNKKYLASGSIFMDYRNNFEEDKSTILYGHHMRNKTMFGELANFKNEDFFKENNLIRVEYKGKTYTYEVFSVYVADLDKDYLKVDFENEADYQKYLNYIQERSIYKTDLQLITNDKIITLYTCSYEFKDARTIVHAKLISQE